MDAASGAGAPPLTDDLPLFVRELVVAARQGERCETLERLGVVFVPSVPLP